MNPNKTAPEPGAQPVAGDTAPSEMLLVAAQPGRGIRWHDLIAEIERDNEAPDDGGKRGRDAA